MVKMVMQLTVACLFVGTIWIVVSTYERRCAAIREKKAYWEGWKRGYTLGKRPDTWPTNMLITNVIIWEHKR